MWLCTRRLQRNESEKNHDIHHGLYTEQQQTLQVHNIVIL